MAQLDFEVNYSNMKIEALRKRGNQNNMDTTPQLGKVVKLDFDVNLSLILKSMYYSSEILLSNWHSCCPHNWVESKKDKEF